MHDDLTRVARSRDWLAEALARRRVQLGFVVTAITLTLAHPTWQSLRSGFLIAVIGEGIRVWAAGHLEKSREVTRSGPYRFNRHPLYVGSTVVAAGVVIASRSWVVALAVAVYMGSTIAAAIRTEEAFLRRAFGSTYDEYLDSRAEPMVRRFSMARAMRNREHRAVAGLLAGFALLALRRWML
jgi:protein-S-isoprenylcysteine O-methyltransferase Ste14